jgi:predicted transglutaminase-like cysteine proteinase
MRGAHAKRAALLMVSCWLAQGASAGDGPSLAVAPPLALTELGPAAMPGGMVSLCAREPSFCSPDTEVPRAFILSAEHWQQLSQVNDSVNHAIASTTDRKLYGKDEYWTIPTTAGDCEDYVLLKRQLLMKMGIEESALLITVVHDENGEGHAVLTVPTDDGDLVLDNRRDEILHWWATGYVFIKRQSETDPDRWVSLGNDKLQAPNIASGPGLP